MSKGKNRQRKINTRPRNYVVLQMVESCKGGSMKDRKKEADKKKCRRPITDE